MTMIRNEATAQEEKPALPPASRLSTADVYLYATVRNRVLDEGADPVMLHAARHAWRLEVAQDLAVLTLLALVTVVCPPALAALTGILLLWLISDMVRSTAPGLLVVTSSDNRNRFIRGGRSRSHSQPLEPQSYLLGGICGLAAVVVVPLVVAIDLDADFATVERATLLTLLALVGVVVSRAFALRRALARPRPDDSLLAAPATVPVTGSATLARALRRLPREVLSVWRLARALRRLPTVIRS